MPCCGCCSRFLNFIASWFAPTPPPANAAYGFQWQAGQGVPNALTGFDVTTGVGPGIYVTFSPTQLDSALYDPFGRGGGAPVGTVFDPAPATSAAMTALMTRMRANPPPGEAAYFNNATAARLADLTGFLSYTNTCLEIIQATAVGAQLLQRINAGRFSVFISPSNAGGNQTASGGVGYVNTLTAALNGYIRNNAIPGAAITAMVDAQYAAVGGGALGRFNQFAADLNALPLCSLFLNQNAFPGNFLNTNFDFNAAPISGQNLLDWLSGAGQAAAFDLNARTFATSVQGVLVRRYFLLALGIVLYPNAPAGAGASSGIRFNVRNEEDNVLGSPDFRPPAIGLAHELMHAMHYSYGTAPGYDYGHFTTTAAELLFVGMGPFAAAPISENAIRAQYGAIAGGIIDASNVWAAPAARDTYEPPAPPNNTAALMRAAARGGMI